MNDSDHHPRPNVALLVDGENLSAQFAGKLITQTRPHGPLIVKRVYGDATLINGWNEAPGFRVIHSGTGKNAADILLAIEAVDLSYSGKIGTFVLASSDGDFSHIAHRLREAGFDVIGIGEEKTGDRFRKACTSFHELTRADTASGLPEPIAEKPALTGLDAQIYATITNGNGQRNMTIASLGMIMHRQHNVRISTRPEKTWRKYLTSKPELYRCDEKGPNACVHLRA